MLLVFAALPTRAKRSRKTIQAIALEEANEADVDRRSGVGRRRRENPAVVAGEVAQHEVTEARMEEKEVIEREELQCTLLETKQATEEVNENEADVDRRSEDGQRRENPAVVAGEVAQHEVVEARRREARQGKARLDESEVTEREEPQRQQREAEWARVVAEVNESDAVDRRGKDGQRRGSPAVVAGEVAQHEATEASRREEGDEEEKPHTPYWRVACADLECCLLLSVGLALLCLAWFLLVNFGGVANRYIWISCLFAPFGTAGVCSSDRCSPCLLAHLSVCPPLRCLVIYRGSASLCGVTIQHLATVCALPFLHLPCQRRGLDWPGSHHHQRWFARLQYRH